MVRFKEKILSVLLSLLLLGLMFPQAIFAMGPPAAPNLLNAVAVSAEQINLTWDPVADANQYYVYRASSTGGTYTYIGRVNVPSFTNTGLTPATAYFYKVQALNGLTPSTYSEEAAAITLPRVASGSGAPNLVKGERIWGTNRYETSAEIAKRGWTVSDYAILANGEVFPDALCAAPLSAKYKAPILLTGKDKLNLAAKNQLLSLKTKKVFLIGGTGVLSLKLEQEISALGIEVQRIAGVDRYETSLNVAKLLGDVTEAVVATGENFPDALSIAPVTALKGMPILLTTKDTLSEGLKDYLAANVQKTYVVGAGGAVSEAVFNRLPSPQRLSGANRYETNIRIIKAFSGELDLTTCYLATGKAFPDALAGSALAALSKSPVILISEELDQVTSLFIQESSGQIKREIAFGGSGAISENLMARVIPVMDQGTSAVSPPSNLAAAALSTTQIKLAWDVVDNANAYNIYRSNSANGEFAFVSSASSNGYTDNGLSPGTLYYYKIQAVNRYGGGVDSAIVNASTFSNIGLPSTPTKLVANLLSTSKIYLTWNPVDNASSYVVSRTQWVGASYQEIATVNTPFYTDYVGSELTYFYKVQAVNGAGKSNSSNTAYAITFNKNSALLPPANVQAQTASNNGVYITWSPVTDVSYYNVYRATATQRSFELIAQIDTTYFFDKGLDLGTTYTYKIQSVNSSGVSEDSTLVHATTLFRTN